MKYGNSENKSEIESNFKNIIKEIKDNFKADQINFGISEEDFNDDNLVDEEDDEDDKSERKDDNDFSSFNASNIIKIP